LTELDLCKNKIGDEGAMKIGESLMTNTTLTKLYLFDNIISSSILTLV